MRGSEAARVLEQPPPEVFELTLHATVSNGVPEAGAGNLETTASEDVYEFATAVAGGLRIGVSSCASSLGYAVDWKLVDAVSGATVGSASTCSAKSLPSVAAGSYRLRVTRTAGRAPTSWTWDPRGRDPDLVRIADRIWPAWRERTERGDEPAIVLLLVPAGDDGAAVAALREAVLEVQGAAGPFPGEWDWLRTGDGILVQVVECEALEEVLPAVAAALGRHGVEGAFELPEPPEAATPPRTAHMLECRLRVRGHRVRRAPRSYLWQPEREAYEAVLAAADGWVRRVKHGARSLTSSTVGPVPVAPDEDVVGRLLEAVGDRMHVSVSAVGAGGFRSIAARAWSGGVSLVAGGAWIESGRWQPALAELTDVLRDQAALIVYGCVRRGWAVSQALLDDALPPDWPPRAGREPDGIGFTSEAFEDVYAPDTFGIQLLGGGYAGRLPDAAAWRCERVADATVVLKHRDPVAWFDAPFVPLRERARGDAGPPPVLATARRELAPLLYQPGVLFRDDLAEEPGL